MFENVWIRNAQCRLSNLFHSVGSKIYGIHYDYMTWYLNVKILRKAILFSTPYVHSRIKTN